MRAALLVFGLALVTGQQFQEDFKTASTAVVLAAPGHFQRNAENFQRRQFSNDLRQEPLTRTRGGHENLRVQSYRGDTHQRNLFSSNLFRSGDADRFQSTRDQFRSGGFRQRERKPLTSQYDRYQEDQRRQYQQNGRDNAFQQGNQGLFQQRRQDNRFQENNERDRFSQTSRGNRFRQANQEGRFRQNNQDNIFHQDNRDSRFHLSRQEGRFQSDNRDSLLRNYNQDNLFQGRSPINRLSSDFVGENRPLRLIVSEDNSQKQGPRFRGSQFGQVESRFLDRDFDLASLPAGARFRLDSVDTSFQCARRPYGFYADQSSGCRVFHVCNPDLFVDGRPQNLESSFMCGEGYTFDQRRRTCVQESLALPCHEASNYY